MANRRLKSRSFAQSTILLGIIASSTVSLAAGWLWVVPASASASATQLAAIYFGFVLTAQSVIFATAFAGTGRWPSMYEVSRATFFVEWLVVGGVATLASAVGALLNFDRLSDGAAFLWIVADAIGTVSFIRLFSLATIDGRNGLLTRTLREGLRRVSSAAAQGPLAQNYAQDTILSAHRSAVEDALETRSASGIGDLVAQTAASQLDAPSYPAVMWYQFSIATRISQAACLDKVDAVRASSALRELLAPAHGLDTNVGLAPGLAMSYPVATSALATRFSAWLSAACFTLATRGSLTMATARQLIDASNELRTAHLRWIDPTPINPTGPEELGSPVRSPAEALYWYRDFTSFQGSASGTSSYSLYQLLTGQRYERNYADGALILHDLTKALYGPDAVPTAGADATRQLLTSAENLDAALTEITVQQLATFRKHADSYPPELRLGGFTDSGRVLAANLAIAGSLANIGTVARARDVTLRFIVPPVTGWSTYCSAADGALNGVIPAPRSPRHRQIGALVLNVCLRIAHTVDDPERLIVEYLSSLPQTFTQESDILANRIQSSPDANQPLGSGQSTLRLCAVARELAGATA
jgi:hypothetical protein